MQGHEGHRRNPEPAALTRGEQELEWALGSLTPGAPAGVDRVKALFDAGVAVGRRRARAWQGAAAVMAVALAASVLMRMPMDADGQRARGITAHGTPQPSPAVAQIAVTFPPATTWSPLVLATRTTSGSGANEYMLPPLPMPGERAGYLRLRDQVLQRGPEALRPTDAAEPLWMADPAARRVVRSSPALRG
jgi:hypothetical protein